MTPELTEQIERDVAESVVEYLKTHDVLAKLPPRIWNSIDDAVMPSLSIKANQGEELVYRYGIYRMNCEARIKVNATKDELDVYSRALRAMLFVNQEAHFQLCNEHLHCWAIEPGGSAISNAGDNRMRVISFNVIAMSLDRYAH